MTLAQTPLSLLFYLLDSEGIFFCCYNRLSSTGQIVNNGRLFHLQLQRLENPRAWHRPLERAPMPCPNPEEERAEMGEVEAGSILITPWIHPFTFSPHPPPLKFRISSLVIIIVTHRETHRAYRVQFVFLCMCV